MVTALVSYCILVWAWLIIWVLWDIKATRRGDNSVAPNLTPSGFSRPLWKGEIGPWGVRPALNSERLIGVPSVKSKRYLRKR